MPGFLVLGREAGEGVTIRCDERELEAEIVVFSIENGVAKIGFKFPREVEVLRTELLCVPEDSGEEIPF